MKFNFFRKKDPLEIDVEEDRTPNITFYFKLLWRKLTRLVSMNILALLQFVPLLVAFLIVLWADTTPTTTANNLAFPVVLGIDTLNETPASKLLLLINSERFNIPIASWGLTIARGVCILVFVLTFGWFNVGFTYLCRELINGRPVFIFSDLKHAIKRNAKQGFLIGLLDVVIIYVVYFNLTTLSSGSISGFVGDLSYWANLAIAIIYFFMRFYIYMIAITFDMKIKKIFKNSFIFVILGIKRNILAVLWIVFMLLLNFAIFVAFTPLGIILPFLYIVTIPTFTASYAAYPIIQRYMIDPSPYAQNNSVEDEQEECEEEEETE